MICHWLHFLEMISLFFYMSGFFFCFSMNKLSNENRPKIALLAIIKRYLRLLPLYLFAIFGITYLIPFLFSGPLYYKMEYFQNECVSYWWRNLLYVNNLFSGASKCVGHGWYLANDMQFFILSLIVFVFFARMKWMQFVSYSAFFIFSCVYQIILIIDNNYTFNGVVDINYFDDFYIKPWNRICPYILGILFYELFSSANDSNGKGIFKRINKHLIKSQLTCIIIYLFSFMLIFFSLFANYLVNNYTLSLFWQCLFITFNKVFFVFSLGLIIHLTFLGRLSLLKSFLSLPLFTSLCKLTYGIYLFHFYIILAFFFSYNTSSYLKYGDYFFYSLGFFVFSMVVSFLSMLLFESPVVNTMRLCLGADKNK